MYMYLCVYIYIHVCKNVYVQMYVLIIYIHVHVSVHVYNGSLVINTYCVIILYPPPSHTHTSDLSLPSSLPFPFQTAITREQELENKLASMQSVINAARELASDSMIVSCQCVYVRVHVSIPPLVGCHVRLHVL